MAKQQRVERPNGRQLEDWERLEQSGFKYPGDWWAGEPPTVDNPLIGYMPDSAPYPHNWPAAKRVEMTWYVKRENIKVDYRPDLPDEGASGWEAAWESMQRHLGMERVRRDQVRALADNPAGTLPEPEPTYVDPGEPRHPRDEIAEW